MYSYELLNLLSDNKFHSGELLAKHFKKSRTAIWHDINKFTELGLTIYRIRSKGYRLIDSIELFSKEKIQSSLSADVKQKIFSLDIYPHIHSTNTILKEHKVANNKYAVALAEYQSAGKGRSGQSWNSPLASNICLSLKFTLENAPANIHLLSLIVALSITKLLASFGLTEHKIKWPNDILISRKKLAGILLECSGEMNGALDVIIGIGLNLFKAPAINNKLALESIALGDVLENSPNRNLIVCKILNQLIQDIEEFIVAPNFAKYLPKFTAYDALFQQTVNITNAGKITSGIANGINSQGALIVKTATGQQAFNSGSVRFC